MANLRSRVSFILGFLIFVGGVRFSSFRASEVGDVNLRFRAGPAIDLKWDDGPVSFGLVMDMGVVSVSGPSSQDLLISRIWQGLFLYPMKRFNANRLRETPLAVGKAGVLMFQPVDWEKDGKTDLIAADRDGFLYLLPAAGVYPGVRYEKSDENVLRDAVSGLAFNIPFENPELPRQDDLGGYTDVQYFNYLFPKMYPEAGSGRKNLIIGDSAGNLWWLPDASDGSGRPSYTGERYGKEKRIHPVGTEYQRKFGLEYAKPAERIGDEAGRPFLLGVGREAGKVFSGAMARPLPYPDPSGRGTGLIVIAGSNRQQVVYLQQVNRGTERKPVFRNVGEIRIDGLDHSLLNCHSKFCLYRNGGRNDLLLGCGNHVAILKNRGWKNGLPGFEFIGWISGPDTRACGYAFSEILSDRAGNRYVLDLDQDHWKLVRVIRKGDGIRLRFSDSPRIRDQNGEFRVPGETDPQLSPDWGYHRMTRWDYDGSGRQHLIAATDKGHLYLLADDSRVGGKESFVFRSMGPLRDASGAIIRIHNRAVAGGIDLNGDGRDDLVVGGISYQLGIRSDPHPGGGIYYLLNMGIDPDGVPRLSPPELLDVGPDFRPRLNSHLGLQVLDLDHDGKKEMVVSLQDPDWGGRIYRQIEGKIAFSFSGFRIPMDAIVEQVLDIDGDGGYEVVRPGDESGVGSYRKLLR